MADIAAILALKQSTVKTRIHRARLFLATELAKLSEGAPSAASPRHARQACLELLHAKQEAMDHGVALNVSDRELCERCRMLFRALEWASSTCRPREEASVPEIVKVRTTEALRRGRRSPADQVDQVDELPRDE